MLDDKCCGTCKYHYHESIDGDWVCVNYESEYVTDWTEHSDYCEKWERKRMMKYKVGDKIKIVRTTDGCRGAEGKIGIITNKPSTEGLTCYKDGFNVDCGDEHVWRIGFESECELLDELTAEEAIRLKCEMCDGRFCNDCKLSSRNNGMGVKCNVLGKNHPERYIEILKQFKKYYEKKEIETEIVDLIRIMKEEGDSTTCIYAYEIDTNEEDVDEKMDELVKQYYEENGGKIYAKFERICRVKS